MFTPSKMARVDAIGPREILDQVTEKLYEMRAIHVEEYGEEDQYFQRGNPLKGASEQSETLVQIRSIIKGLNLDAEDFETTHKISEVRKALKNRVPSLQQKISRKLNKKEQLENKLAEKQTFLENLRPFTSLPLNFEHYTGYKKIDAFHGYIDQVPSFEEIDKYDVYTSKTNKKTFIALFVDKNESETAYDALTTNGFKEVPLPRKKGDPEKIIEQTKKEIEKHSNKLSETKKELKELKEKGGDLLLAVEEHLSMEVDKKEFPLQVAVSNNSFVISGWIPSKTVEKVKKTLQSMDKRIYFEVLQEVEKKETGENPPPVAYDNPQPSKPFEYFTDLFSRPSYTEIDPTILISMAFPFIYGMMLGDIGYGLATLLIGIYLLKTSFSIGGKSLGYSLTLAGTSSIIFGIIYAEALGPVALGTVWAEFFNNLIGFHVLPLVERNLFSKHVQIPLLVMLTVWIGILQVGGGFIIDFYNSLLENYSTKHAVFHNLSWLLLMTAFIGIATSQYNILLMPKFPSNTLYLFLALILASVAMIIKGEGAIGVMEVPSRIFSHTFSFTRIAAVGLSSVGIALVINMFAELFIFEMGGIMMAAGILVYIFGHLGNIMLGVFACTLHSIRLQWVEFFTKFFQGGGEKFRPFGKVKQFLEVEKNG